MKSFEIVIAGIFDLCPRERGDLLDDTSLQLCVPVATPGVHDEMLLLHGSTPWTDVALLLQIHTGNSQGFNSIVSTFCENILSVSITFHLFINSIRSSMLMAEPFAAV